MVDYLAEKLVSAAIASGSVNADDREVYLFGYQALIEKALSWGSILILSAFLHKLPGALVFVFFFIPLRSHAGGYHARTVLVCYSTSVLMFIAFCFTEPYLLNFVNKVSVCISVALFAAIIVILAPIADENKPIMQAEARQYKKRTYIILFVEIGIILVLINIPQAKELLLFAMFALASVSVLLLAAIQSKKKTIINDSQH